jgi:gliding motility-associated-like protein
VNPIPVTTVNSTTICPAGTATLTAAGAASYSWSTGAVTNPISVTPAATSTYTVTGTSLGCSSTAVSTVTVNAALIVNAGLDDSVCYGMSITLGVTPNGAGYSYAWTPAATLSSGGTIFNPVASPTATTTYSVTVTDPSGCTGTDNVTIYADPQITMAIAGINVTCNGACNGQTIVIPGGGSPGYAYLWNTGCTGASCTGLCPGTYTVTVTDSWGCTATSSAGVTEPTLLTAATTASTPASCNGVCDGTATAAGAGGTVGAGYSYSWNTMPAQPTPAANGLCAGSYTCTITDANGCTATTTVTITEPTLVVTAPIASVVICNGGTATLTAVTTGGNPGGYTYNWLPAGTGATAAVTVSPAGTTTYTVNAFDALHSCPAAPVTVTVTVNPPLAVVANGTASICPGASTVISAIGSFGNGGPYTYTWAPAGTGSGSPVTVSPAATTTYTVTADDGCSPPVTATVTVTVLPLPVINFTASNLSGCEPLCVTLIDNSTVTGGTIATWAWTFDGTTSSSSSPAHCFANPGSYTIGLTVTSSLGGCVSSATNTNMITVYPNPVASFTAPLSTSIIDPIVNFTDNSTNAASWHWNFGDPLATGIDSISNLENPIHNYSLEGTYCVTLSVTSINGCVNATQLCVVIDPEFTFFIPNAFSPNGDGINDEFYGKGDYISDFEMTIFDRWGNLIFFSDDINKHWDGKANHGSQLAQEDVYVYVVKIKDHKNSKHKYTGTVTIVK